MVKHILLSIFFIGLIFISRAQSALISADKKPKLVVGITIEQMRNEYIDRYWDTFQNDGFKRLVQNGAVFKQARLDLQTINAATGTATIYTGVMPSLHGIVGNEWYKQLTRERKYAVKDPYFLTVGSDSNKGNCSANQLKTSTLGDVLKMQTNGKSKVFSVALNPESAVLSVGHHADGAFWFDATNGHFISSSYYIDRFPEWVRKFNEQKTADTYLNGRWETLLPIGSYTDGFADDYDQERGFWKMQNTFPYDLRKFDSKVEDKYQMLKATPFGNRMVKDFVSTLIHENHLGDDEYTDLLSITFSSLDFANSWFEPASVEMHDLYLRMDQEIAQLLKQLDQEVGKDQYIVFLTAASTSDYSAKVRKEAFNFPSGEFSPQTALALLRAYLNILFGSGDWVIMYNEEQIYLNHDLIEQRNKNLDDIQQKVALFLNQFEGIRAALPAYTIETSNMVNPRFRAIENSYCVQRSGDVILLLEEGWAPASKAITAAFSSENRVPLIFYGSQIKPGSIDEMVDVTDIVPTICNLIGIFPPDDAQGNVVKGLFW